MTRFFKVIISHKGLCGLVLPYLVLSWHDPGHFAGLGPGGHQVVWMRVNEE